MSAMTYFPDLGPCSYFEEGYHSCGFCRFSRGPTHLQYNNLVLGTGRNNLFVPAPESKVFVAPSLIAHYIDAHDYQPPQAFQQAVLACPNVKSPEYLQTIAMRGLRI